jgi:hypothetical protein
MLGFRNGLKTLQTFCSGHDNFSPDFTPIFHGSAFYCFRMCVQDPTTTVISHVGFLLVLCACCTHAVLVLYMCVMHRCVRKNHYEPFSC